MFLRYIIWLFFNVRAMILMVTGICDNRFREFSILRTKCGNLIFLTYSTFIFLWSIFSLRDFNFANET